MVEGGDCRQDDASKPPEIRDSSDISMRGQQHSEAEDWCDGRRVVDGCSYHARSDRLNYSRGYRATPFTKSLLLCVQPRLFSVVPFAFPRWVNTVGFGL
jgi:hypothetical protein